MKELEQIIIDLQEVISNTNLNISDEFTLDCAVRILNSQSINNSKQTYNSKYKEEPATEKQVNMIKQLNKGVVPAGITKREAMKLIGELHR